MKKTLIALVLLASAVFAIAACTESTGAPPYVEPAMEGFTIAETASEPSTESASSTSQAAESESVLRTEAKTSFSAGTARQTATASKARPAPTITATVRASQASTTRPVTAAQTAATTRYVPPAATTTTTTTQTITTTTARAATTTTRPSTTTTTTRTTTAQALSDYEAMGQTLYQTKAIEALNALRAGRGLAPMAQSPALMTSCLAQAQKMAAAGKAFHTEGIPPGFESVASMPYYWPAQVMGENLANHVSNFLEPQYGNVGIAVVRSGNQIYAVMQGN